jgi:hypothetical protein
MHDLRKSPTYGEETLQGLLRAAFRRTRRFLWTPDRRYFRRAVRPNELFFVISYGDSGRFFRNFLNELDGEGDVEVRSSISPSEAD